LNKVLAIVNNACCRRKKSDDVNRLLASLRTRCNADVKFTEYAGHATEIAGNSSGYDIIIAAGGDGTVSEVVNGMDLQSQALGIMPLGSGNGLAHDLKITSPEKALDALQQNKYRKIDLINCELRIKGKIHRRYAVSTTGMGLVSRAAGFTNNYRYLKKTGHLCYFLAACFTIAGQQIIPARLKIDNGPFQKIEFTFFMVNNTMYTGSLFMFPQAALDDSKISLFSAKMGVAKQILYNIGIVTRAYKYTPGVLSDAKNLCVNLESPGLFMADGELFDAVEEITYKVSEGLLRVLA